MQRKQISLWLPTSLLEQVETYCHKSKISRTGLIQKCLELFFEGNLGKQDNSINNSTIISKLEDIEKKIEQLAKGSVKNQNKQSPSQLGKRINRQNASEKTISELPQKIIRKENKLPPKLHEYLHGSNFSRAQFFSIEETLYAIVQANGKATAKQIANFRRLGRPESVRRQIDRLEKDGIIFRDRTTIPHTFILSEEYTLD